MSYIKSGKSFILYVLAFGWMEASNLLITHSKDLPNSQKEIRLDTEMDR